MSSETESNALKSRLAFPFLAKIFFWVDLILNAILINLALAGGADKSDPKIVLLLVPVICTILCLNRAVPFGAYAGYLRIPYVLILLGVLLGGPIAEGKRAALVLFGVAALWHIPYALSVRAVQKSKARLGAIRMIAKAAVASAGEDEAPGGEAS